MKGAGLVKGVPHKRYKGVIVFHPDDREHRYSMPDPTDESLTEALHQLRYNLTAATQADAYRVLAAAEAFCHLATHPAGSNSMVRKLREIRRVVLDDSSSLAAEVKP